MSAAPSEQSISLTQEMVDKACTKIASCALCDKPFRHKESRVLGAFRVDPENNPNMVCMYALHTRCMERMTKADAMAIDARETKAFMTMLQSLPTRGGVQ